MAQKFSLSREAMELSEELHDAWHEAAADGVVEGQELMALTPLVVEVSQITLLVDHAQRAAVATMRRGSGSRNACDRLNDLIEAEELFLELATDKTEAA